MSETNGSLQSFRHFGLVASMVLRCDDCITYHLIRDAFAVALVVGAPS